MKAITHFDEIFLPRNVAVVGASPTEFYTFSLLMGKLRGHFYPVNPNYQEVQGLKCYASVLDIEGPLDYVILALPARHVLKTVDECIRKGVKCIHTFTSGFSETGLPEGIERERELAALIKGKVRMIGPNCMGVYCPRSGLSFNAGSTQIEGHIGVISQSGTFAQGFIYAERSRNVNISKMVSYGNAIDLDCPEFLTYLADDPDTYVIALYVEGVKEGGPIRTALEYAASRKPVVALKGGVTKQGGRVASSHTGALAGSGETWATLFRQTGVVQVDDFDDLLNTVILLGDSPLPAGNEVSIVTYSGGFSVVQSDICIKAGLEVPQFSPEAVKELREFVPASGTMIGNPLDAWQLFYKYGENERSLKDVFRIVAGEQDIHSIILQFDVIRFMIDMWGDKVEERLKVITDRILEGCLYARDEKGKLMIISMFMDTYTENELERKLSIAFKGRCESEGFPVFPSLNAAVRAVSNVYRYTKIGRGRLLKAG
jgi:acyl-CoA synthetase (NDP forming)